MTPALQTWAADVQRLVEEELARRLPAAAAAPARLHDAMRYAVLGGGKRVRPLLAFAAGELSAAPQPAVLQAACAVELIHAYSLVHDDLPMMDDDSLRRGKPTVHVEYDQATALLAGDALQSLAFEVLAAPQPPLDAVRQRDMLGLLAQAAGSHGMAGGQATDLASVGRMLTAPELEFMHIHKTGALIRAAVRLGAWCGTPLDVEAERRLDHYAKCMGLAFQVVDDVLDAEAPTATLGKTAGKDAHDGKPTYVSVLGLAAAKELAEELRRNALDALTPFGNRARHLAELADYITHRSY